MTFRRCKYCFRQKLNISFKMTLSLVFLVLFVCSVFGNDCPRRNRRPQTECVDECHPLKGCYISNHDCLCDGDCGYSCVKKNLKCRNFKLRNGKVVGDGRNFNATLKFRCDDKYTLFGSLHRRCRANGNWDGKRPRCRIACRDPGVPNFARRNKKQSSTGFQEKTVLTFHCFPGYRMKSSSSIECQSSGKWSGSPPVCEARNCGRVKLPSNSEVIRPRNWKNSRTHLYGIRMILRCKSGYRKSGLGVMRCDGSWKMLTPDFHCLSRSCGDPGTPRNGKKTGLAYTFKKIVRYSCDDCYILDGQPYRQCLANGKWSDSLPSCKEITCADPGGIANGEIIISSKPMYCSTSVDFKCSIGYELKGASRRTCTSDGNWSSSQPKCEIVDCGNPGSPINGRTIAKNGFTYAQDISFACYEGYVMEGSSLATCQDNGHWSKDLPKCLEKCSDPRSVTNAVIVGNKFYHGKRVRFYCSKLNDVLVPSQSTELTCTDGTWSGEIPSCKAPCSSLNRDQLRHGRIRPSGTKHGSRTSFACYDGYKLTGSSRSTCNDGRWSHPVPKCSAICPKTSSIRNGWVIGNGNLEGNQISFRCKQDYVLDGQEKLTCRSDRRWSAGIPTCKAPCQRLQKPDDGKITRQGFKHNEEVHFTCDDDYTLEGQKVLTCSDGFWSEHAPRCFAPCQKISNNQLFHGYIKQQGFHHGDSVTFDCHYPFIIDGQSKLYCTNGKWDKAMPSCAEPCRPFNPPLHGGIIKNNTRHRQETTFSCNKGYKLVGQNRHICNFGRWSGISPTCLAICPKTSTIRNGWVNGKGNLEGNQISFRCKQDYVLDGHEKLTCRSDRSWSARKPTCKAPCQRLRKPDDGKITKQGFKHNEDVHFTCDDDYSLEGQKVLTCFDGFWSENAPRCSAQCPNSSYIRDGKVQGEGIRPGSKRRFTCNNRKFNLVGEKMVTCLKNGQWDNPWPKCVYNAKPVKDCVVVTGIKGGRAIKNQTHHGGKVVFACLNSSHTIVGKKKMRCVSGKWSNNKPKCVASCKPIVAPQNGSQRKLTKYKIQIEFKCNKGYSLKGKHRLTCKDRVWDYVAPTCVKKSDDDR